MPPKKTIISDDVHLVLIRKRVKSLIACLNYPPSEDRLKDLNS